MVEFEKWLKTIEKYIDKMDTIYWMEEAWEAAWDIQQAKIDEQAKELEALRGFINKMRNIPVNDNRFKNQSLELAEKYGLINENGNPTPLLTGIKPDEH